MFGLGKSAQRSKIDRDAAVGLAVASNIAIPLSSGAGTYGAKRRPAYRVGAPSGSHLIVLFCD